MLIDVAEADPLDVYRALVGVVTPRPIAWVTTVGKDGHINLAPFSFFNVFGASPPVVIFSPTRRRDGRPKDSLRNVEETGEFVLNAAVEPLAGPMNLSAKDVPYGESEVELAGLTLVPSLRVRPPRVAESPAHLECKVLQILPIGTGPLAANLVIGEVVTIHVADEVLDADGRVDPKKLRSVGRLGGDDYCRTTDTFSMGRPR